jgi:hypothetical protein
MPEEYNPKIGDWYTDVRGATFEVVAYDEDDGTVEIQYFDGTVEELDIDTWEQMEIQPTEAPEDWSGSLDIEREDYGVDLEENKHDTWASPLDEIDLED